MEKYNHKKIEQKWQAVWEASHAHEHKNDATKEKFYMLDMFPYPSGDGLHMGHTESYTASDVVARFKKMQGYDVLHPQGFDSFGLPAENYAIKTGVHPKETTETNANNYIRQMKALGLSHDLENLVYTSHPDYYKWTQYFFGKFFENDLVVRKTDKINWCPSCNTGIANEQVEDGKCERCKTGIVQKEIPGWFFKTTDFAGALARDLDTVDWPEATKKNQRAWIGESNGAEIEFGIKNQESRIKVFTTRPDTLFGATYLVLAPENEIITNYKLQITNWDEVHEYVAKAKNKTELERKENKEKTGVKIEGVMAINPANQEEIPIFVADYVLGGYGTGAIMAVPAHDERDFEFAQKFDLPIIRVIDPLEMFAAKLGDSLDDAEQKTKEHIDKIRNEQVAYVYNGTLINSGKFDGMNSEEAKKAITEFVGGKMQTQYKLRDWSVSRQRYWGCPIPIVYSPEGQARFVGEENLPWALPEDVDFVPTGESPLAKSKELRERTEKLFGEKWTPEVDTMDTFVDSSWYFLRYPDTKNEKEFCAPETLKRWLPVDLYIGGAEHTYMHLLYARFFTKALKKIGLVDFNEPFTKLRHQGMVFDKNGVKMSKSKGNVVNPDEMVERFGADATRLYMLFAGPLDEDVMWNEDSVVGTYRFLEKVWKLQGKLSEAGGAIEKQLHKTIKKVTEDIEGLRYNTAIAQMMIFTNTAEKEGLTKEQYQTFIALLAPFAPHIAEELWHALGNETSIHETQWPTYDAAKVVDDEVTIAVQVNGKVRGEFSAPKDISEEQAKAQALGLENIQKYLEGNEPKKIIYVAGKIVNIVI